MALTSKPSKTSKAAQGFNKRVQQQKAASARLSSSLGKSSPSSSPKSSSQNFSSSTSKSSSNSGSSSAAQRQAEIERAAGINSTVTSRLGGSPTTAVKPVTVAPSLSMTGTQLGKKVASPVELKQYTDAGLTENDIVRQGKDIFLKSGVDMSSLQSRGMQLPQSGQAPINIGSKIRNVNELNQYAKMGLTENDIVRKGADIFFKSGVTPDTLKARSADNVPFSASAPAAGSNISTDALAPSAVDSSTLTDWSFNTSSPDAFVNSIKVLYDSFKTDAQKLLEQKQTEATDKMAGYIDELGNKKDRYDQLNKKYQVDKQYKDLMKVNSLMAQKMGEYMQGAVDIEGQTIPQGLLIGQGAALQRQQAADMGILGARAAALQGNIELAQNLIDRSLDVEFGTIQAQIDNTQNLLSIYGDQLSTKEKEQASKVQAVLDERQRILDEKKEDKKMKYELMLEVAQAGGNVKDIDFNKSLEENIALVAPYLVNKDDSSTLSEAQILSAAQTLMNNGLATNLTDAIAQVRAASSGNYSYTSDSIASADAKTIADAIKQVESGGNYRAAGASGEGGAYQFMPGTWNQYYKEYAEANGIYGPNPPITSASPEEQDAVAQWKIQQWLDQGYGADQIASLWNHGSPDYEGVVGTNKYGVHYDTPAYVNKVLSAVNRISQTRGGDQYSSSLTPDQVNTANTIIDNARQNKDFSDFLTIRNSYEQIANAANNPSAAGDMSLIFAYMKMLDPTSVVREGEQASAQNAAGVPAQIQNLYNKVLTGERLNDAQRQDFSSRAGQLYESRHSHYQTAYDQVYRQLKAAKIDPDLFLSDLSANEPPQSGGNTMIGYMDSDGNFQAGSNDYSALKSQLGPGEFLATDSDGNIVAVTQAELASGNYTKL